MSHTEIQNHLVAIAYQAGNIFALPPHKPPPTKPTRKTLSPKQILPQRKSSLMESKMPYQIALYFPKNIRLKNDSNCMRRTLLDLSSILSMVHITSNMTWGSQVFRWLYRKWRTDCWRDL